jgi:hypothetical protein
MDINKQLITGDILIKQSPIHGWGVFTQKDISQNDIITQSVLIKTPIDIYHPTNILPYTYNYNNYLFLPLGHASLINSSNEPNSRFEIDLENNIITIIAICDIFINEEITLKYL